MDLDDDFIVVTVGLYKFFMAHGKDGLDAKQLYDHLVFTSRVQGSKKVKANLQYIKNGLGWGNAKIKKAKSFLRGAGLIEYVKTKGELGLFDGQSIIIKTRWDEESMAVWVERKRAREAGQSVGAENQSEENFVESTGSETEPVEHMVSEIGTTPDIQRVNYRTGGFTDPLVSRHNYKGVITNNPSAKSPKEKIKEVVENSDSPPSPASLPPAAGITSVNEMKKFLLGMVKKRDPESMLYFTPAESEQIGIAYSRFGSEWLIEVFHDYLQRKEISQINKFHSADVPRFIKRAMDKSPKQPVKVSKEPKYHNCPVCGKTWSASSTLSMCPKCGLELENFSNHQEIEEHRKWWESPDNPRRQAVG